MATTALQGAAAIRRNVDFITNHAYHGDDNPATDLTRRTRLPIEMATTMRAAGQTALLIEEVGIKPAPTSKTAAVADAQGSYQRLLDEKQAVGYMPWGFMQGPDNGDGDEELGLDHRWHEPDWQAQAHAE
ncbi:hypothetical protein [Candidatus Amarolinea aalborgensis]|uniref:hypothetical protein n=1 Tax=Candidatus Amarolinea aalborgensis TaxID=2249329 RepID=UPI003BF95499